LSQETRTNLLRLAGLILVIGLSATIYIFRDQARSLALLGYPGIFVLAMLSNATILFPAPGVAVVFAMGGLFNPIGVALAAGTGGAIGELSGYVAGLSGQAVIERITLYDRIAPHIKKYGPWAILVLAAIPNPFFDLAGAAAGILKMPIRHFFLAAWAGQIIKMSIFAFAGSLSFGWFAQ